MNNQDVQRIGLLNVIQALHMSMTGSGDPVDEEEYYNAILDRLVNWKIHDYGLVEWCYYDDAVYRLCRAVVDEYKARRKT